MHTTDGVVNSGTPDHMRSGGGAATIFPAVQRIVAALDLAAADVARLAVSHVHGEPLAATLEPVRALLLDVPARLREAVAAGAPLPGTDAAADFLALADPDGPHGELWDIIRDNRGDLRERMSIQGAAQVPPSSRACFAEDYPTGEPSTEAGRYIFSAVAASVRRLARYLENPNGPSRTPDLALAEPPCGPECPESGPAASTVADALVVAEGVDGRAAHVLHALEGLDKTSPAYQHRRHFVRTLQAAYLALGRSVDRYVKPGLRGPVLALLEQADTLVYSTMYRANDWPTSEGVRERLECALTLAESALHFARLAPALCSVPLYTIEHAATCLNSAIETVRQDSMAALDALDGADAAAGSGPEVEA